MPNNPAYGTLSPRQARIVRGNSQSVDAVHVNRGKSKFDLGYSNYMSTRFGEVRPFFYATGLAGDNIKLRSVHELWSDQLKSPLMANLTMFKDFFYIPYKALMPNTWDLFKNVPVQGDDVPEDVYTIMPLHMLYMAIRKPIVNALTFEDTEIGPDVKLRYAFSTLCLYYHLCSNNSLLVQLGIDYSRYFNFGNEYDFDAEFESRIGQLFTQYFVDFAFSLRMTEFGLLNSRQYTIVDNSVFNVKGFQRFMSDFVSLGFPEVFSVSASFKESSSVKTAASAVNVIIQNLYTTGMGDRTAFVDFSPVYAYQMVGSQFYVNDKVDTIFTAKDWYSNMDYLYSLMMGRVASSASAAPLVPNNTREFFSYNGQRYEYDLFSLCSVYNVLNKFNETSYELKMYQDVNGEDLSPVDAFYAFMYNLIIPFESIRFLDYFTGSRLNPLAVGASTEAVVSVENNKVSAIDVTKSIAWQSFLNDINKFGPISWIQQSGIFGNIPSSLDPMPREISRESCPIGSMQIENNSNENQGNIISRMRSESGQYMFSIDLDEDCIILGLCSFDIPRVYSHKNSRFAFVYDRNDFFNPYFQNIGDQEVYTAESYMFNSDIFGSVTYTYSHTLHTFDFESDVFGWQIRDTQYKQRYSVASGAFVGDRYLPSWAFISDEAENVRLNSFYVRNHNSDFDKYYVSLPNVSNSGYYHFYIRFNNVCDATRRMQKRPNIQLPQFHH